MFLSSQLLFEKGWGNYDYSRLPKSSGVPLLLQIPAIYFEYKVNININSSIGKWNPILDGIQRPGQHLF